MPFSFPAIATVSNHRQGLEDDHWGSVISTITLEADYPADLFKGLDTFSHVEVIFVFHHKALPADVPPTRHPRNNPDWPRLGLLVQRSAHHPNPIGLTTARIVSVAGRVLTVEGLDAVDGTPVLDLKPVFREFQAQDVKQPDWVSQLMAHYWT